MARASRLHIPTIIAVSVVAWVLFATLHEIVGHGLVAMLFGERFVGAVSTTVHIVDFDDPGRAADRIGWWGFRTVAAGGSLVNFATAVVALLALRSGRVRSPATGFFLWLFASISLFQQAFWLAVMPWLELGGDWTAFFIGLQPAWPWRVVVSGVGVATLWTGIRLPFATWRPTLAADPGVRRRQRLALTGVPVAAAVVVQALSVIWSPLSGGRHTWIVTIFTFLPVLLWLAIVNRSGRWPAAKGTGEIEIGRSAGWLLAGAAAFTLFVALLGPGIGSFEGHPHFRGPR